MNLACIACLNMNYFQFSEISFKLIKESSLPLFQLNAVVIVITKMLSKDSLNEFLIYASRICITLFIQMLK